MRPKLCPKVRPKVCPKSVPENGSPESAYFFGKTCVYNFRAHYSVAIHSQVHYSGPLFGHTRPTARAHFSGTLFGHNIFGVVFKPTTTNIRAHDLPFGRCSYLGPCPPAHTYNGGWEPDLDHMGGGPRVPPTYPHIYIYICFDIL